MYKILLLTDFSAASRHAITFTQTLFDDTAADFCLFHAFPIEPQEGFSGAFLMAEQRQQSESSLQNLQHTITQQPVPAYHTYRSMVIPGGPVGAVETLLAEEHYDLVVVGSTGMGRSEFFGSVATGLIRAATTNVLVVPASAPIRPLTDIVLATDFRSVNDAGSLTFLTDLSARKEALLTLLTVQNPQHPGTQANEASRRSVEKALGSAQTDAYTIHDNDVLHGINAYLDIHEVDLLVMLPHHKGLFDVFRNKSVTRAVAYHPRVPLLTLYDSETVVPTTEKTSGKLNNTVPFASSL